jgi:ribosomal protein S18 acetylase RimI-like enzyme
MIVRKAVSTDSEAISACLFLPMEDIVYKLIGEKDFGKALAFMRYFVGNESNQYSWQNCRVAEHEGRVVAAINLYDGAQLHALRKPVIDYIQNHFNRHITPEDETQAGEFYIDSLGVQPEHRCKGIATSLLKFLIDEFVISQNQTLGLLVDDDNASALRLYRRLGFKSVGRKVLLGKELEHLQLRMMVGLS